MALESYRQKRDFTQTSEPVGGRKNSPMHRSRKLADGGLFVVQKHAALRLHYDLRLEVNGVLKSWAVPKGPSLNPKDRRLAVAVEDHPFDYANFEGTIPKGNYGAGSVIVWDRGTFESKNIEAGLKEGNIKFELKGEKLRGRWVLVRMHDNGSGETDAVNRNWLLIKERDEFANPLGDVTADLPKSVLCGKTVESIDKQEADKRTKQKAKRARADGRA
jgi:bifunctional non-homologous end joining protein LigD